MTTTSALPAPPAQASPGPSISVACGNLLLERLEALELALGDAASLEDCVQDLLDAAAALRHATPQETAEPTATARAGVPWPSPGQTLWQYVEHPGKTPEAGRVQWTFAGLDERDWCVLELADSEGGVRYATRPLLALSASADGPTFLRDALRHPAFAHSLLRRSGIVDDQGRLTPEFGGTP